MAKINIGSATGSVIIGGSVSSSRISTGQPLDDSLFTELRTCIEQMQNVGEKMQLLAAVNELETTRGSSRYTENYKSFMQAAANHMTVLAPFLPALTKFLG